jgi:hypothetical protein
MTTSIKERIDNPWIPEVEVAGMLGVHFNTVKNWIKSGRLKHKVIKKKKSKQVFVLKSSLKTAFDAKCVICGKIFKAKHPEKARFCSIKHKSAWYNRLNAMK